MLNDLGVAFDVMLDTVNAIDVSLLRPRDGVDPILYFYEDFLEVYDNSAPGGPPKLVLVSCHGETAFVADDAPAWVLAAID